MVILNNNYNEIQIKQDFEKLFVNNPDLKKVEIYLNRFNPIRTMRMEGMEIRHSAILAWLLDPRETHGFGDKFLRAFLCEAMRGQVELGSPTALEISQVDMRDAVVRREWQNIDIFILLPRLNWAFIIENKFHSRQHVGQLAKYTEKVKNIFEPQEGKLKVRGVFLTLEDEPPEDENFAPIQYSAICEILPNLMENDAEIVRNDVAIFVRHYLEIIREETGMSEEREGVEALARQLYRSHKKALDFIMEYGATTDFVIAMESICGEGVKEDDNFQVENQSFVFSWHNYESASFLPLGWVQKLGKDSTWEGCENWWAGYPLICWFHLKEDAEGTSGHLRLFAEVGPLSNYDFRKTLITKIDEAARKNSVKLINFQRGASEQGKKYSKFLKNNSIHIQDIQNADEIEKAMRSLIRKFIPIFSIVESVIEEFKLYIINYEN